MANQDPGLHDGEASTAPAELNVNASPDPKLPRTDQTDTKKQVSCGGNTQQADLPLRGEDVPVGVGPAKKKKKKSKNRSTLSKGANKPTGFEEYYVDAPVTPDEYNEELELYHESKDFTERIQIAIQRFSAKRKFGEVQKALWDNYLQFGGIDTGPSMFGGGTDPADTDLTAADIARLKATKYVSKFVLDGEAEVDFDGVLRAFISCRMPRYLETWTQENINQRLAVLRSFFNYLLYHNVCPEYKEQINNARRTCDTAEVELLKTYQNSSQLPGAFSKACSILFGGYYYNTYVGDAEWAQVMSGSSGMHPKEATRVFQGGLAAHGSDSMCDDYNYHISSNQAKRISTKTANLRVVGIEFSDDEVKALYAHPTMAGCHVLGKLRCETWVDPTGPDEDLTEEEEAEVKLTGPEIKTYEFWVEDRILSNVFLGMLMEAEVHQLSFGVWYFDTITTIMCSFFSHLPNSEMEGWRPHVYLPPRERNDPSKMNVYVPEVGQGVQQIGGEQPQGKGDEDEDEDEDPRLAQYEKGEDIVIGV